MSDNLRCETCSHWRTAVDVDRRICPMWGWWTYADDWCVAYYEPVPFAGRCEWRVGPTKEVRGLQDSPG